MELSLLYLNFSLVNRIFAPAKAHGDNALQAVESYEQMVQVLNTTEKIRNQTDATTAFVRTLVTDLLI